MTPNVERIRTVWFVSRHPGAIGWIRQQANMPWTIDHFVDHLDLAGVKAGDVVLGTLPVHMASAICAIGAEYWHLSLDTAKNQRGQELTTEEIIRANACLVRYDIREIDALCPRQ